MNSGWQPPLTPLQVESVYYDGRLNKRWRACLLAEEADRTVLVRPHGSPVWSPKAGHWLPPGPAIEIYPRDRWFNAFFALDPGSPTWQEEAIHTCYMNVALPPALGGTTLQYVDLDLDIGLNVDFSYRAYDEDEFLRHCDLMKYPTALCDRVRATFDSLVEMIEKRDPFFGAWEAYTQMIPSSFVTGTMSALFPSVSYKRSDVGAAKGRA